MKIEEIRKTLHAELLSQGGDSEREISKCFASDLMSDVLNLIQPGALLLTGLANAQVIRTADMSDIGTICFVRGKCPDTETLILAGEHDITLMTTNLSMFECCGLLAGHLICCLKES